MENEARWEQYFQELVAFKRKHGHCDVAFRGAYGSLGVWVVHQRRRKRRGRLSADGCRRLEELSFSWDSRADTWDKRLEQLVAYKKRFGDCDVPDGWLEDPRLAHWVANQRGARRRGLLSSDRVRRLDEVGFSWSVRFHSNTPWRRHRHRGTVLEEHWDWTFGKLARFRKKYGHCSVPKSCPEAGLCRWVKARREEWKTGSLRRDRQKRLKRLGFELKHRSFSWERAMEKLLAYKKRFGHCDVPSHWPKDRSLANWVSTQRAWGRKGWLSKDRTQQLNRVGFSWSPRLGKHNVRSPPQVTVGDQLWEVKCTPNADA
jgi:hypothetical protein